MMSPRALGFVLFLLFAAVVTRATGGNIGRGAAPLRAWDGIVSTTIFADIGDFKRDLQQATSERMYTFLVLDEKGGVALSIVVAIAPAGSRLPPMEWQALFTAADSTTRARYFPSIGARARAMEPRFSPDGALSSLTFATSDGFFDVSVSVFEASSKANRPPLTAEDAARRINAAYEATRE
jgi:hypothetical protein